VFAVVMRVAFSHCPFGSKLLHTAVAVVCGQGKCCLFAIALKVHPAWILHARISRNELLSLEEKSEVNRLPVGELGKDVQVVGCAAP
jgi:hypothetical protein